MQTGNVAMNGKRLLPTILDYEFFTDEPVTSKISQRLSEFYGGSVNRNGLSMNTISEVNYIQLITILNNFLSLTIFIFYDWR